MDTARAPGRNQSAGGVETDLFVPLAEVVALGFAPLLLLAYPLPIAGLLDLILATDVAAMVASVTTIAVACLWIAFVTSVIWLRRQG